MLIANLLLAASFQVGPFYQQKESDFAIRPFYSREGETTDVLWPLYTSHRDWWRLLFFTHYQENDRGDQFELMPIFWKGSGESVDGESESYWGLFPVCGHHPHILMIYDIDFALWPLWTRYRMPRGHDEPWLETNAVLFPFIHWRNDGSGGVWPLYVCNQQRESYHRAFLWPFFTWADYESDRDTAGAGKSWMIWPIAGGVTREREDQWLFLPPLFSYAETRSKLKGMDESASEFKLRAPWPIFEYESTLRRDRISVWPIYENVTLKTYSGDISSSVTRFGWKLVELYDDETRVFPFWVSRKDDTYFRLWPFWESEVGPDGVRRGRFLTLFPIRNVPSVDRNWSKFWTLYESAEAENHTDHSLFWGIIRWRTERD